MNLEEIFNIVVAVVVGGFWIWIPLFIFLSDVWKKYKSYDNLYQEKCRLGQINRELKKKIGIQEHLLSESDIIKKNQEEEFNKVIERARLLLEKNNKYILEKFKYVAEFISDANMTIFDDMIVHLKCKDRPAYSSAEKVKQMKEIAKQYELKYKLMKYEYDMLFSLFPELENYLEYFGTTQVKNIENIKDDYDYAKRYLSKDEYKALSENERNQLALDRYIEKRNKTKWQIGRDYELYIGFLYASKGYNVEYFGIEKQLEDLGRDLIATNDNEILVIQCKNWSKEKIIYEKHICQLYGTYIHFKKNTKTAKKIKPVFITSTQLSDMAKEFAKYLKVKVVENLDLQEFPRIKCNISKTGEKIYHLPFDQKYDYVKIDKVGECYATTVQEAVTKGFRRAKKYFNTSV